MNINQHLIGYKQSDIENLYMSGSITPNIDSFGNLIIQNVQGEMYSSSITIPLQNFVFNPTKVQTRLNVLFQSL